MRKLTKIIGVALIATGLMVSVTGCADPNSGLAELQAENEQLKKDKAKLQKQLDDLSSSLDSIIETAVDTSLEDKIKAISDEIADLNAKLKGSSVDTTTYETKIAELTARVNELIAENEQLKEATTTKYVITFNKALWKYGEKHIIDITDKNGYFKDKEFKVGTENTLSLSVSESELYIDNNGKISNNLSDLGNIVYLIQGFCDIDGNTITKVSNADTEILLKVSTPINNSSDEEELI